MSLWGDEFVVETTQNKSKKLLNKVNNPKQVKKTKQTKLSTEDRISLIEENVNSILGKYAKSTIVIKTKEDFDKYINDCIERGIVALDTETNNSLDPLTCKLMGLCLYSPGLSAAYVPVNHVDRYTNERLSWQLTEKDIQEGILKLKNTKIITHNGKFDYKVIKCTCNCAFNIYWDSMIAARILDENEFSAGLKQQYISKIDPLEEKYSIDHLFEKVEYTILDPELFALYAATDAYKTYKLYEWQNVEFDKVDNIRLRNLLFEVEFPIIIVTAEMELDGISLDIEYCERLSKKYHKKLDDVNEKLSKELEILKPKIDAWRQTKEANSYSTRLYKGEQVLNKKTRNEQLEDPPALTSPMQLAILLYDILKVPTIDKNNPRSTGEEVLKQIDLPIVKLIIEQRTLLKLLDAFIDALPKLASERDGKIHSNFNQLGTDTGRFSCTEPNLQQIPARNLEVRMMFCAGPGKILVTSDYSQQEPRILTAFSRDRKLLESYEAGRDLYATLGAGVYKNNYWDNMEHHKDGSDNLEGKKRRKKMKTLYLGMSYGMGPRKLSEDMHCSLDEAIKIVDDFHNGFPEVSSWMRKTEEDACIKGYVEDFWGRRRRLPDLLLPEYSFKMNNNQARFNPLIGSSNKYLDENLVNKYKVKLNSMKRFQEYDAIKKEAEKEGLEIIKNGGFISRSKRQCVNARIQGSAATMTKKAMIAIYNDELMRQYGFRLLVGVHDELIGECYEQYANEASERLVYLMKSCVPELNVPIKCDPTIEKHWYEEEYAKNIVKEFTSGKTIDTLVDEHSESTRELIESYLQNV
ncbi:MAG: hypothetical protein IJH55_02685 [Romboutsia sp.]|nr:hypothetical protein [Romboutsia sp.]